MAFSQYIVYSHLWNALNELIINTFFNNIFIHKSTFGPRPKGIAWSSVLIQRNSPRTQVIVSETILRSHQEKELGKEEL